MRSFIILVCCLALAGVLRADPDDHPPKKKNAGQAQQQPPPQQHQQQQVRKLGKHNAGQVNNPGQGIKAVKAADEGQWPTYHAAKPHDDLQLKGHGKGGGQKFNAKHFDIKAAPKADIASVKFKQGNHIEGSQNWKGQKYDAFKNYRAQKHDKFWWNHHHNRIILICGGWYYWNTGFWYPAWGYDTAYEYYPYDGPIYAYNDLPPDQVIANVQSSLQEQGYYTGEIDGLLGPLTRAALASYQRDHGLYTTAAIDQPTLASLGMG